MDTYERIKELCDSRGIAITTLEAEIGFGRGSIGKLKKGGKTTPERLQKIADYFGVSVSYLIGEAGELKLSGEAARIVRRALDRREAWDLLVEMQNAHTDDLRAITDMLKRLNAYSAKIQQEE